MEAAIKQRLVVCVLAVVLLFFGLRAATKLSVDAFPDVTNVQVQIATEAHRPFARGGRALCHRAGGNGDDRRCRAWKRCARSTRRACR
ncbi:efflux RND transporter permease subunit [Cupriavidus basilensis]